MVGGAAGPKVPQMVLATCDADLVSIVRGCTMFFLLRLLTPATAANRQAGPAPAGRKLLALVICPNFTLRKGCY